MLSLVFCVGEANDSDPKLVVPKMKSTNSITSTGVVSTVRLFGFLLLPLASASGDMILELLGVLPNTNLALSSGISNASFGFTGIPFAGITTGALLCSVSLFRGNILHICCMVIFVFVLPDIVGGLCIGVTVIYFVMMGSEL